MNKILDVIPIEIQAGMMQLAIIIGFTLALTVSCGPSNFRSEEGIARDNIFSVEKAYNGAYSVFLVHDDSVVYCTNDSEVGEEALAVLQEHDGEAILRFRYPLSSDDETSFWQFAKCDTYNGAFALVKLESISRSPGR